MLGQPSYKPHWPAGNTSTAEPSTPSNLSQYRSLTISASSSHKSVLFPRKQHVASYTQLCRSRGLAMLGQPSYKPHWPAGNTGTAEPPTPSNLSQYCSLTILAFAPPPHPPPQVALTAGHSKAKSASSQTTKSFSFKESHMLQARVTPELVILNSAVQET